MNQKWDKRFIDLAYLVSSWSRDPSTKCGAVIVDPHKRIVSVGFNGFPRGTNDDEQLYADRKEKYPRVVHAEQNAILFSKRDITNCTIYVVPMLPCSQCAAAIIQSGITQVIAVAADPKTACRWDNFRTSMKMFDEAGVTYKIIHR